MYARDLNQHPPTHGLTPGEQRIPAQQRMDTLTELASSLAHNFNNLMAVVLANLEMMEKETTLKGEEYRLAAIASVLGGTETISSLLAFSRQQSLNPVTIDINAHLAKVADIIRRILGEKIELSMKMEADLWPVRMDAVQLESALADLTTNAHDAMPEGGKFIITTRNVDLDTSPRDSDLLPGPYVCLELKDTGNGMSPAVMARAFEPYFTTKDVGTSSGLGLSVVYGFIKQSNGHIMFESAIGQGTSAIIYLPCADNAAKKLSAKTKDSQEMPMGHGETILVVEDNPDVRDVLVKQLKSLGYETIEAMNGRQALEVLDGDVKCDMIISDILMPGELSGYDVAHNVRVQHPSIRILLTSGFLNDTAQKQWEILPGTQVEFLGKPYRKSDLAQRLDEILHSSGNNKGQSKPYN